MTLLILTMLRAGWALRCDSHVTSLALLAVIAIISGTGFYSIVEGLRFVDALYFSVVTLTTVGYGDFAPKRTRASSSLLYTYSSESASFSPSSLRLQRKPRKCRCYTRRTADPHEATVWVDERTLA